MIKLPYGNRIHHKHQPLHDKIKNKDCQILSLGDSGFLQFFRVVSSDSGKPRGKSKLFWEDDGWHNTTLYLQLHPRRVIEVSSDPISIHCSLRVSLTITFFWPRFFFCSKDFLFFSDLKSSHAYHFEKTWLLLSKDGEISSHFRLIVHIVDELNCGFKVKNEPYPSLLPLM